MNKKLLLVTIAVSSVLLTGCSLTRDKQQDDSMKQDVAMMQNDKPMQDVAMEQTAVMPQNMSGKQMEPQTQVMVKDPMMSGDMQKTVMQGQPATYAEYSPEAVTQALAAGKHVALFFHAARCPSCRGLDKDLTADVATLPKDSVVFKIDYDSSSALKKQYGVTTQHTIVVIDAQQNKTSKKVGADVADIAAMLK